MWRAFCNRRGKRSAAGTRKQSCESGWIGDKSTRMNPHGVYRLQYGDRLPEHKSLKSNNKPQKHLPSSNDSLLKRKIPFDTIIVTRRNTSQFFFENTKLLVNCDLNDANFPALQKLKASFNCR